MDQRHIICISRECGSGGRAVGRIIADRLGIPLYDKETIRKAAEEQGFAEEAFEKADEKPDRWYMRYTLPGEPVPGSGLYSAMYYTAYDRLFDLQSETIRKLAEKGSGVFIGRLAADILEKDPDRLSMFICGSPEDRTERIMQLYGFDREKAEKHMRKTDKQRAGYHDFYSDRRWGRCGSYDLSISTSRFGIEGAAQLILSLLAGEKPHPDSLPQAGP